MENKAHADSASSTPGALDATTNNSSCNSPTDIQHPRFAAVTRTPSAVDFPGAFTTKPKHPDPRNVASLEKFAIFPNSMKSKVAEAVGGSLANVVDNVYSLVSYVNPLSSEPPKLPQSVLAEQANAAKAAVEGSSATSTPQGAVDGTPPTPDSIDNQRPRKDSGAADEPEKAEPPSAGMLLQVPSAGTSVAADLDEHCLADANADNPESNRPPTPTKGSFARMLRFPTPVTDPSMHASSAEYKQAVQNDPVSRNVSQRTGLRFRPGTEEKRRYMRRMSKAPQLDAPEDLEPAHRSTSRRRSTTASGSVSQQEDTSEDSATESDDSNEEDVSEVLPELEKIYHDAAATQRNESKVRAIESWRFVSPRVKRVKRRALWRLFLAQEITPSIYDEATTQMHQSIGKSVRSNSNSTTSSPIMSPHHQSRNYQGVSPITAGALSSPRREVSGTVEASDAGSLRRRMLETATMRNPGDLDATSLRQGSAKGVSAQTSSNMLKKRTPSITPSVDSHNSAKHMVKNHSPDHGKQNSIWTMEFSACGKYLAAGGHDGVVRIWRIAPFAREQEREKQQQQRNMHSPKGSIDHAGDNRASGAASPVISPAHLSNKPTLSRAHGRQQSSAFADGSDMMPFANSAPIAKGKHSRSFSVGQPLLAARNNAHEVGAIGGLQMPATVLEGTDANEEAAAVVSPGSADMPVVAAPLHPMHAHELLEPVPFRSYVGHTADVLSLSWSKNGFLLSASMDRTVRLWHPHRPECLCTFRHRDIVTSVAFSPRDDRLFISGSLDCRLRLWDIPARGVRHWTRLPEGQMVTSAAFTSPKGDYIVAGTYRGMCVFYSTNGLAVQGRMHARSSRGRNAKGSKITGFAYAPTGQMSPQLTRRLLGPGAQELAAGLDSTNYKLLVSSNDSRLRMFLPEARQLERKYKGHANVSSQAFARLSSDGRYVVSGSEDHNIYVWSVAQDNAATVATHPHSDHIRRVGRAATVGNGNGKHEKQPLMAALFGRRRQSESKHEANKVQSNAEWESLDGKVEEKSIYEYFPAHDAAVSQALFAPAATLQYLADHDDPILSRPKMRHTNSSGEVENLAPANSHGTFGDNSDAHPGDSEDAGLVEDMTAIIVSADTSGNIRVFRKDINVHRRFVRKSTGQCTSRSSLVRAKESISSLSRAIGHDEVDDLSNYSMVRSKHSTMDKRQANEAQKTLTRLQLQQLPQQQHLQQRPASRRTVVSSNNSTAPSRMSQPEPLGAQRPTSFWNKLGRRMTQKRNNSTFAGVPSTVDDDNAVKLRARAASGGADTTAAAASLDLAHGSPALLPFVATPASGTQDNRADESCKYCGHQHFMEFAVAQSSSGSNNHHAPSLLVCRNCKRVKDIPE
ncbi:hypothetical protein GGI25_001082 [Coemansia spiralis]|uniref:Uncharacterized protein n=2 Tax=Coemansia TaxID=4863 RepID=A0A9W8GDD3_9FUNG|nr:hypothetical protein EDC05_000752 [Coemansia umbellata]KAJ2625153.1 hypothetical protein GGI26_000956 [Coemansia sp. RSA 1358]KAJ2679893.1 hypothetical protein GGI25_001082 [Coemansia spiralis]